MSLANLGSLQTNLSVPSTTKCPSPSMSRPGSAGATKTLPNPTSFRIKHGDYESKSLLVSTAANTEAATSKAPTVTATAHMRRKVKAVRGPKTTATTAVEATAPPPNSNKNPMVIRLRRSSPPSTSAANAGSITPSTTSDLGLASSAADGASAPTGTITVLPQRRTLRAKRGEKKATATAASAEASSAAQTGLISTVCDLQDFDSEAADPEDDEYVPVFYGTPGLVSGSGSSAAVLAVAAAPTAALALSVHGLKENHEVNKLPEAFSLSKIVSEGSASRPNATLAVQAAVGSSGLIRHVLRPIEEYESMSTAELIAECEAFHAYIDQMRAANASTAAASAPAAAAAQTAEEKEVDPNFYPPLPTALSKFEQELQQILEQNVVWFSLPDDASSDDDLQDADCGRCVLSPPGSVCSPPVNGKNAQLIAKDFCSSDAILSADNRTKQKEDCKEAPPAVCEKHNFVEEIDEDDDPPPSYEEVMAMANCFKEALETPLFNPSHIPVGAGQAYAVTPCAAAANSADALVQLMDNKWYGESKSIAPAAAGRTIKAQKSLFGKVKSCLRSFF